MATAARDRLARTLRSHVQAPYSVDLTARTADLSLQVEGFGQVRFPVTPAKARKLAGLGPPGPVRAWRGDANRSRCPRHVGDPEAPHPRRVERRHAEGHPRDGERRTRTTERCRTGGGSFTPSWSMSRTSSSSPTRTPRKTTRWSAP